MDYDYDLSLEPKWLEPKTQLTDTTNTSWPLARYGPWPVKYQTHSMEHVTCQSIQLQTLLLDLGIKC